VKKDHSSAAFERVRDDGFTPIDRWWRKSTRAGAMYLISRSARCLLSVGLVVVAMSGQGLAGPAHGQDDPAVTERVSIVKPTKVAASEERISALKVADGYTVEPFATGLGNIRVLAVGPDGQLYAARRERGRAR
jgi:glucose/arabinose dehydrogenase